MDRLRKALADVDRFKFHLDLSENVWTRETLNAFCDGIDVLAAAARVVADAETVTICATHLWPPLPSVPHTCMRGLPGAPSDPLPDKCRMVERLLVDPGSLS